jgi:ABC-type uncharacterized transport system auxiliary subunit
MIKKNILIIILSLSFCLSGCFGVNNKYVEQQKYGLSVSEAKYSLHNTGKILEIFYPTIDSQFAGSNFVYRIDNLRYAYDYYNTFFISPLEQINRNEVKYLQSTKLFTYASDTIYPLQPNYILKTHISELYADYRDTLKPKAIMALQFTLLDITPNSTPKIVFSKSLSRSAILSQKSSDALVATWSDELASILRQLSNLCAKKIRA